MSITTLTSGRKWPYLLLSLAILMLGFAGSFYSHSRGHQHIHTTDQVQSAVEHEHIQLSGNNELGIDFLLHCGADILDDWALKGSPDSNHRNVKFARYDSTVNAYHPIKDPPPPRFSS